ncbi:MAG: Uma2 family endonuclease, partial [Planctomycetes bacterium]|nr:Uma2 family endonuclease [Planctomycetota bacterium]
MERIHLYPWPGLATEKDVVEIHARTGRLCELVDGILVEKPMGFYESAIAIAIGRSIGNYLEVRNLG